MFLVAFGVGQTFLVFAADHSNLEENIPTQVEDAYPLPYLNREFQSSFRYEQTRDGADSFRLEPRVEVGFARNWQDRISTPFLMGSADQSGSRNLIAEAMYNFNQESLLMPAVHNWMGSYLLRDFLLSHSGCTTPGIQNKEAYRISVGYGFGL